MASTFESVDFQHDRIARITVDVDLWFDSTCRRALPADVLSARRGERLPPERSAKSRRANSADGIVADENPDLWNKFKSYDIDAMIDELVQYKKTHDPDDKRRILDCGIPDVMVRVE